MKCRFSRKFRRQENKRKTNYLINESNYFSVFVGQLAVGPE